MKFNPIGKFRNKKTARRAGLTMVIGMLSFAAVFGNPVSYEFLVYQNLCPWLDNTGLREGFMKFTSRLPGRGGLAECVKFVDSESGIAGLGVNARDLGLLGQGMPRPEANVRLDIIKQSRDMLMESRGWELLAENSLCDEFNDCVQYWYTYSAHNAVTDLGVNQTIYNLILTPGADYAITGFSWTQGSTFTATNTTCTQEVTTGGLAKERGVLSNTTASSSSVKMFIVVNQTATASTPNISGMCLSWKPNTASAPNSLFAGVDIADFTLAAGDKVNGQWTVQVDGV